MRFSCEVRHCPATLETLLRHGRTRFLNGAIFMSAPLTMTSLVQWDKDQIAAAVDREVVILSVERGCYFGLDEIGSEIWEKLASPSRIDAICAALADKYDADRPTIERDVLTLIEQLAAEGLISVVA
jgi:hypothetical protein